MGTTKLFIRGVLALGLVALLSGSGLAADRAPAADTLSFSDANAAPPPMTGTPSSDLVRASRVMHCNLKGADGKTLGRVHDIVLTPDLKSVSYVVVSRGALGIGNSLYAIPWSAISRNANGAFMASITAQQLAQRRGFSPSHWPTSATLQGPVYGDETAATSKSVNLRRFSRIKGMNAKGSDGAHVGDVHDMVIALDTGQIAYTILAHGGFLGIGPSLAAVPENAITLEPALRVARVNATQATTKAYSFKSTRWPDLASPSYSQQVAMAYGVAPAGAALAYVPPEGTTAVARAPRTTSPSARSTTPPASTTTPSAMPEPTSSELTGTFDASKITTIDGTVIGLGKFQPTSGSEMLWLRVRPESGQPVLVNLGPRSYISTQNVYLVPGDRIHMSGSRVTATASGKQVFLPTEITFEGHTLRLRSATGAPLWEGQTTTPATPPLGYAPAEESTTAPGRSTTTSPSATMAEPMPDELTGRFNPSAITSIDGTVIDVGKVRTPATGQDMLWLRVRTNDGRTVLASLGPRNYVSRQDFYLVRGDRVHLTGSEVATTAAGRRLFLPTELSYNSHTLRLRSATGTPLWETQTGTTEPSTSSQTQSKAPSSGTPPLGYTPSQSQDTQTSSQQTTTPGTGGTSRSTRRSTAEPNEPNKP